MTNEEAKKMLKAKLECLKNETSGINHDCNMRLCDGCPLNYEQGNMGEQKEALEMAINTLEQSSWIPVSERLPKENISVIGTTKYNDIYETELYDDCGEPKWYADGYYDVPIVAWIPLPEQYEEESEEEE